MIAKLKNYSEFSEISNTESLVYIYKNIDEFKSLSDDEKLYKFIESQIDRKKDISYLKSIDQVQVFVHIGEGDSRVDVLEKLRRKAAEVHELIKSSGAENSAIICDNNEYQIAFVEGLVLKNYTFNKYISETDKWFLKEINVRFNNEESGLSDILSAVYWSRDLVNEPPSHLTARNLSDRLETLSENSEIEVEVFGKSKIEALKMGGLLGVNMGSVQEPTFNILTYKPKNARNKKPIVLVGKGVVYDTGGINLKPTGYLETMKSDMSGSAVVSGLIKAIAANKLPVYMIVLIPATDNRPGKDAIVPGDILTMYNGKTVEVINTDAEGRLILADGLAFADKFDPELVLSVATLTGAAQAAFGTKVIAAMGNADEKMKDLISAGFETGERVAELPFWDDYGDEVKSKIADLKNLGGKTAGAITAGKFLENFTKSPYLHLDIAGVSFMDSDDHYRPAGGTGSGVRLLYKFIENSILK